MNEERYSFIRKNIQDSKNIPLGESVWFILLTIKAKKISSEEYRTTKDDKSKLFRRINELELKKEYFKIYGVWNGQWNTHLFDMDIKILKERIEEAGVYSWAKDDKKDNQSMVKVKYILKENEK